MDSQWDNANLGYSVNPKIKEIENNRIAWPILIESIKLICDVYVSRVTHHLWFFELKAQFWRFPAKCNNLGKSFKTHQQIEKLIYNEKKNKALEVQKATDERVHYF